MNSELLYMLYFKLMDQENLSKSELIMKRVTVETITLHQEVLQEQLKLELENLENAKEKSN